MEVDSATLLFKWLFGFFLATGSIYFITGTLRNLFD